jgi:hypothetical protein
MQPPDVSNLRPLTSNIPGVASVDMDHMDLPIAIYYQNLPMN